MKASDFEDALFKLLDVRKRSYSGDDSSEDQIEINKLTKIDDRRYVLSIKVTKVPAGGNNANN